MVRLPILGTIRVQLPDPGNFRVVFAQMGLDRQTPLLGKFAQPRHQLIGAGWCKPGRQNGLDMTELPAALQPPQRLPLRFLRGLLEVDAAVAVHIDLTHVARDAGPFQLLHQHQCGVRMEGGKHGHPCGTAVNQRFRQPFIDRLGVFQVRKPCLQRECIGVEPVQQGQIHAHTHLGELGAVKMQIGEGLQNQPVSIIRHRLLAAGQLRQTFQNGTLFIQPQAAAGQAGQFSQLCGRYDGSSQNHCEALLLDEKTKCAPGGHTSAPPDTHRKALGGFVETPAPDQQDYMCMHDLFFSVYHNSVSDASRHWVFPWRCCHPFPLWPPWASPFSWSEPPQP